MTSATLACLTRGAGVPCQDYAAAIDLGHAVILVVADGAGGVAGSEHAAQLVVERIERHARSATDVIDPVPWVRLLAALDAAIASEGSLGESTAIVCAMDAHGNCGGVSVGDSSAWVVSPSGVLDLTARQKRKPLLGSGRAVVVPFFHRLATPWTVLVGTDGLFNYSPRTRILELVAATRSVEELAVELAEAVQLPSGGFQDDIAVVIARR